jgi:hypothetical protein
MGGRLGRRISADDTTVAASLPSVGVVSTSQGGNGQDSSAWTGVVRTDTGVWSAAEVLKLTGTGLLTVEVGDLAGTGLTYANAKHAFGAILDNAPGAANLNISTSIPAITHATVLDHYGIFSTILTAHDATAQPQCSAIAVWGQASIQGSPKGWAIGLQGYATTVGAGDDGLLLGVASELRNLGTVGSIAGNNQKVNLWLANHMEQVTAALIMQDGHNGTTYGWESGFLMYDCGESFIRLLDPTGYPFGTAASTTGILMQNSVNWKSAMSIPNDVWIWSNYASGSVNALRLIKGNADDATISLGVTKTAVSVAGNFSATKYVLIKDSSGNSCYVPCADAAW